MTPRDIEVPVTVAGAPAVLRGDLVGEGAGPLTVLLHGGGPGCSSAADFAAVTAELARERRLLRLDLLQMGRSDHRPIDAPVWSFHADTLREVLDHLGEDTVDVVAQSMGSAVTVAFAARHPDRVRRAVLTSLAPFTPDRTAALGGDPGLGAEAWRRCFAAGAPTRDTLAEVLGRYEWAQPSALPDALVELRRRTTARPHQAELAADRSLRGRPEDLEPLLPTLAPRTALVWGEHDPFVTSEMRAATCAALAPTVAEVLPGTSHHPQSEDPDGWLDVVRPFLLT